MQSLKLRLATAKTHLKPTQTKVITADGRELHEKRDVDGNVVVTASAIRHWGFVGDTRPDMMMAEVEPGLYLGGQDPAADIDYLQSYGVTHVLNAATLVECKFPSRITYLELNITDTPTTDIRQHFDRAYHFIDTCLTMGGKCFVHCNAGVSRSPTICIAYLMRRRCYTLDVAFARVKRVRPSTQPNVGFYKQLQAYDDVLADHRTEVERIRSLKAKKQPLHEEDL